MELPPPPIVFTSPLRRQTLPPAITSSDEESEQSSLSIESPVAFSKIQESSYKSSEEEYQDIYHDAWEYTDFRLNQLFEEPVEYEDYTEVFKVLYQDYQW